MKSPHKLAEMLIAAATGSADELLDGGAVRMAAGVVLFEQRGEAVAGERAGLAFVENDKLRVNREVMEVLADKPEAEAVQRGDLSGVEECELFRKDVGVTNRCLLQLVLQCLPQSGAHLGGGGLSEGDEQQPVEGYAIAQQLQASLDECARLTGARTRDDKHVAARGDGRLLGEGEGAHGSSSSATDFASVR